MDHSNDQEINNFSLPIDRSTLNITCNWQISNNKNFFDAFTIVPSSRKSKIEIEEMVTTDTCIFLQPTKSNPGKCMLDLELTNGQRISKIAVISEACILEFFKQSGEYDTTVSAEFIDEFHDTSVYFAETDIHPYTSKASIRFVRTIDRTSTMWIYGIALYVTKASNEPMNISSRNLFDCMMADLMTRWNLDSEKNNISENKEIEVKEPLKKNIVPCNSDIQAYIDTKFQVLEEKLMERLNEVEQSTNKKLDSILKHLENHSSVKETSYIT